MPKTRFLIPVLFFALFTGGTCHYDQNQVDPGCRATTTSCRWGRPYVCADGQWRPVGDLACTATCCMTRMGVHGCVAASSCVPELEAGR
jgi:hypothetical protein